MSKKLLFFAAFAVMITSFYGCPIGIDYPLAKTGGEKINKDLIGTWVAEGDGEVKKATISKNDDNSYKITVEERGEMYSLETDNLSGWITELDGKSFLIFKPENEEKYYHYMIKESGKRTMVTCDVSLLDGGVDAVTSTETLREQVSLSMKKAEFCVETTRWTKQ